MTTFHETSLNGLTGKTAKISFKNSAESKRGTITKKKGKFFITPKGEKVKERIELENVLCVQKLT